MVRRDSDRQIEVAWDMGERARRADIQLTERGIGTWAWSVVYGELAAPGGVQGARRGTNASRIVVPR